MKNTKRYMTCLLLFIPCLSFSGNWFCGHWNSTINSLDEHPKTIAVRVEVVDKVTGLPVQNCQVTFKGSYRTEQRSSRDLGGPKPSQHKEFERTAITPSDGIAVGAFGWAKDYPWDKGIDEAEKVQRVEVRHPNYAYNQQTLPFISLFSTSTGQRKHDIFRESWINEYSHPTLKCFVLDLGTDFPDYRNFASTHPAFFEKIRMKNWDTLYDEPRNWFSKGDYPQSLCGPYFAYLLRIEIEPITSKIQIVN